MKATLKYKYVRLPHIRDKLKAAPIGTMARRYTLPVIFIVLRPSSSLVVRAMIWVISVAKARCPVVRRIADDNGKLHRALASTHTHDSLRFLRLAEKFN